MMIDGRSGVRRPLTDPVDVNLAEEPDLMVELGPLLAEDFEDTPELPRNFQSLRRRQRLDPPIATQRLRRASVANAEIVSALQVTEPARG